MRKGDPDVAISDTLENEAAHTLARAGFDVEQNPAPQNHKKPDYKINGEYFDALAPKSAKPRNVWDRIREKIEAKQTDRIVLILDRTPVTAEQVSVELQLDPIEDLKQIIAIQNGQWETIWP